MNRIISWGATLTVAALGAVACGDDDIILPPLTGGLAGTGGSAVSGGGTGGASASAGAGGASAGAGGASAGSGGATPGTGGSTTGQGGTSAGAGGIASGSGGRGGSGDAPVAEETDAGLIVQPPDAGACTGPSCVCAIDVITAVPYSQQWQTTDDSEADVVDLDCQICDNTDDHIVTFTAPATATYRFFASSGGDVELAVYPGDCTAAPNDVSCGEDIDLSSDDFNDQLELELTQGTTVTVVVGESCEENGGAGTLSIDVAP